MTDQFPISLQREDDEFLEQQSEFLGVFSPPKANYSVLDQWFDRFTPLQPLVSYF